MIPLLLIAAALLLAPFLAAVPDEAIWSPYLVALTLAAGAWCLVKPPTQVSVTGRQLLAIRLFGGFIALSAVSWLWQWLVVNHGSPVYMDAMARTFCYWLSGLSLLFAIPKMAERRSWLYGLALIMVTASTIVSVCGLQHYLFMVRAGESSWREFGLSSPDFFAGLLVITIPLTLALFFAAPAGRSIWMLFGLGAVVQTLAMLVTGSRFAILTFAISVATLAALTFIAVRAGMIVQSETRNRVKALLIIGLVGGIAVSKPLLSRLTPEKRAAQAHSGDFRVQTWRGVLHMIEVKPVVGGGPGTYVYRYQRYAIVGFTRLAHNSYLQTAAEVGIPALLVLLLAFAAVKWSGIQALRRVPAPIEPIIEAVEQPRSRKKRDRTPVKAAAPPPEDWLDAVAPADDRMLIGGLISGVIAGVIQNMIDSNWYVTADGFALWASAGLVLAFAVRSIPAAAAAPVTRGARFANLVAATFLAIGAITMGTWGYASSSAATAADVLASGKDFSALKAGQRLYETAESLNPWRAEYPSELALQVYLADDRPKAEAALRRAYALEPSGRNARRLARVLLDHGDLTGALQAAQAGLQVEPHFVDLLLISADIKGRSGDTAGQIEDYRKVAAIEASPVGTVRAVTEIVDINYIPADLALGQFEIKQGNPGAAIPFLERARSAVQQYVDEGGSTNLMRMPLTGQRRNTAKDAELHDQYQTIMDSLVQASVRAYGPGAAAPLEAGRKQYLDRFAKLMAS